MKSKLEAIATLLCSEANLSEEITPDAQTGLIEYAIAPYRERWNNVLFAESIQYLEFVANKGKKSRKCNPSRSFPCGRSCQPHKNKNGSARQCRNPLEGQAKTAQEWLKTNTSTKPSINSSQTKTQDQKTSQKSPGRSRKTEAQKLQDVLPTGTKITEKVDSSGVSRTYEFEIGGKKVEFTAVARTGFFGYENSIDVDFTVDGGLAKGEVDPRDGTRISIGVLRVMQSELNSRPVGTQFITIPLTGDGLGADRSSAYTKFGFKPFGGGDGGILVGASTRDSNGRIRLE